MKKIMFNDRYGLTEAVLSGRNTMTRRIVPINLYNQTDWKAVKEGDFEAVVDGEGDLHDIRECGMYKKGEVVAVAQKYSDCWDYYEQQWKQRDDPENWHTPDAILGDAVQETKGWGNKMFVRADLMPHHIRITDIGVERLQDISDDDCRREGIIHIEWTQYLEQDWNDFSPQKTKKHDLWTLPKFEEELINAWKGSSPENFCATAPRTAFIVLFAKLSKKTPAAMSELNPWVFVYSFELID